MVVDSGIPNFRGCRIPAPSRLNLEFILDQLSDYSDTTVALKLAFGWPLGAEGEPPPSVRYANHSGARDFPEDIDRYVVAESDSGSSIGPFSSNPLSRPLVFSPLNSCPKRDSAERRVISDLSFPIGRSVNDMIPRDTYLGQPTNLKFPNVDSLVELIRVKGRGCALFKRDLRKAYRQIPVDPGDIHLLAFHWHGLIYIDRCLIMGQRSAAYCCQATTEAVCHIFRKYGFDLIAYIDDLASAETWVKASVAFDKLGTLLREFGLDESPTKACPPSTVMTFLGVKFDTVSWTLEVTAERLQELRELTTSWLPRISATRTEVESIIGKLNFVAACVRPGRIFISRMLNFLRSLPRTGAHPLSPGFLMDIQWWHRFLPLYNGVSMFPAKDWEVVDQVLASDACLLGCGAWTQDREYFHCQFPEHLLSLDLHINALELLTVAVCCKVWGHKWLGKKIRIYCDNQASVTVLNSGRSRDQFMQSCLREIMFLAARFQFEIQAIHLPGVDNRLPDLLSRWSLGEQYQAEFQRVIGDSPATQIYVYPGLFEFSHDW